MEYTKWEAQSGSWCISITWSSNILLSLGKSGLKISKVILGAMSYGDPKWQGWVLDEKESLPILEHAYKMGINTWDTVNHLPPLQAFSGTYAFGFVGRYLFQWSLRGNNLQSPRGVQNSSLQDCHPEQVLFRGGHNWRSTKPRSSRYD